MILGSAWFLKGCPINSEVWIGFALQVLHALEVIPSQIHRLFTLAQLKGLTDNVS